MSNPAFPHRHDLDDTSRCPLGVRCEACGVEGDDLAVGTATTALGVLCLTLCPRCGTAAMAPPVSVGTATPPRRAALRPPRHRPRRDGRGAARRPGRVVNCSLGPTPDACTTAATVVLRSGDVLVVLACEQHGRAAVGAVPARSFAT